jgi:cobalt/nickel transport system permease protein
LQPVFELFSDIFAYRDNALSRIDPRVKLVLALLAIAGVILSAGYAFPLTILACSLTGMLAVRMPARLMLIRLAAPLGIVLVVILLQSLLIGSTLLFTISLFGWKIAVMREGVLHGALVGTRVLGAVSVLLLLSSTTRAHQIFHALRWFGVPKCWVEVSMLMYRYVFLLLDQAADVMDAQRVRLGYSGLRRCLSSSGVLAGTVIKVAMDQGIRTYEAMEVRGYKGYMPFGAMPRISSKDLWILCLISATTVIAYIWLEWGIL